MTRTLTILGGAGGIGRALVGTAVTRGWRVEVVDLFSTLTKWHAPEGVHVTGFDASGNGALEHALDGEPTDGFVNLAGFMGKSQPVVDAPADDWHHLIDGNLTTAHRAAVVMAPRIKDGGAFVNVGSGLGHFARAGYGPYAVAKAGISALTRQLALELAPRIRVNCVAPSAVDTEFLYGGSHRGTPVELPRFDTKAYGASNPMGRIATPADIVGPILFLLSQDAAYVNGQTLHVNGGAFMT